MLRHYKERKKQSEERCGFRSYFFGDIYPARNSYLGSAFIMVHISDIKKRFRQSIMLGTGEAYLLQKKYPQLNVVKDIVHASTHNLAYDSQCEPSRAAYLYAIICLSEYKEEIVDTILA